MWSTVRTLLLILFLSITTIGAYAIETDAHSVYEPRVNLAGSIVDKANRPIPGATVYIYIAGPRMGEGIYCPHCYIDCGKVGQTDIKGGFRIKSVAPDLIFRLLVVKSGYVSRYIDNVDPKKVSRPIILEKNKALNRERDITGVVLDRDGLPVIGASVELLGVPLESGSIDDTVEGVEKLRSQTIKDATAFHVRKKLNTIISARVRSTPCA